MNLTKAQKDILIEILANDGEVNNYSQRLRSIQPLLNANIIRKNVIRDENDLTCGVRFEIV